MNELKIWLSWGLICVTYRDWINSISIELFKLEKTLKIIESNHKLTTAFLVIVEHDKVSLEPSFLQTKPPQLTQLFLVSPVF